MNILFERHEELDASNGTQDLALPVTITARLADQGVLLVTSSILIKKLAIAQPPALRRIIDLGAGLSFDNLHYQALVKAMSIADDFWIELVDWAEEDHPLPDPDAEIPF